MGTAATKIDRDVEYYPVISISCSLCIVDAVVKLNANDEFEAGPNVGKDRKKFIYQTNFKYGNYE